MTSCLISWTSKSRKFEMAELRPLKSLPTQFKHQLEDGLSASTG